MQIFSRLAVHADNRRECDGSLLAKLYKTVELLSTDDNWKALTLGKLEDLSVLVTRTECTEVYSVFDIARSDEPS